MIKIAAFIFVGVLPIFPTKEFLSWSRLLKAGQLPSVSATKLGSLRSLIQLQLAGMTVVILGAAPMAKGVGAG